MVALQANQLAGSEEAILQSHSSLEMSWGLMKRASTKRLPMVPFRFSCRAEGSVWYLLCDICDVHDQNSKVG